MIYLKSFKLLDDYNEHIVTEMEQRRIFINYYPLGIFPLKDFQNIEFDKITIFYGGNGSGKTTLLNIISEKIGADRKSNFNKGSIFEKYVSLCDFEEAYDKPLEIKMISSDDIFDYLLDVRAINSNVNRMKEKLTKEYLNLKFSEDNSNFENYEEVKAMAESKNRTMSKFIRERIGNNNISEQ